MVQLIKYKLPRNEMIISRSINICKIDELECIQANRLNVECNKCEIRLIDFELEKRKRMDK